VAQFGDAAILGAMRATEHGAMLLQAVTDDRAAALRAFWRHDGDGAFEAVEIPGLVPAHDLESFVVFIAAVIAFHHRRLLLPAKWSPVVVPCRSNCNAWLQAWFRHGNLHAEEVFRAEFRAGYDRGLVFSGS